MENVTTAARDMVTKSWETCKWKFASFIFSLTLTIRHIATEINWTTAFLLFLVEIASRQVTTRSPLQR